MLNSAVYVKVKKLGIARAIGASAFPPGGESDMLDRVEILGFVVNNTAQPPTVKT